MRRQAMALTCGCAPWSGFICPVHCQWQGCTDAQHTDACIRGERTEEPVTTMPCECPDAGCPNRVAVYLT